MTDQAPIPDAETEAPRRRAAPSPIWLVPILAVAVSAFLIWQNVQQRGPIAYIAFENGSGITAGETQLRYRDVAVGLVEEVGFTDALDRVVATVRLTETVAPFVDDDAAFYVVRPEVSAQGISGLDTVLSGVYIDGRWNLEPDGLVTEHLGLEGAPLGDPGREGLRIVLSSEGGSGLRGQSPILYKGVEVGQVGDVRLSEDGITALADAIVFAPYDRLVTQATRFWDASGFDFSIGAGGALLDVASLSSLVSGGVVFDTVVSGGGAVEEGSQFRLYGSEDAARRAMFQPGANRRPLQFTAIFEGEIGGLTVDAPVELRGIEVGSVTQLSGIVDEARFGDDNVRLLTTLELRPSQIGLNMEDGDPVGFLAGRVEDGLRAKLVSASLLTGGLKVQLVDEPGVPPAALDLEALPYPLFPTAAADISSVTTTAEGLFERLSNLPVEALLDTAVLTLDGAARLLASPDTQAIPGEVRGVIGEVAGAASDIRAVTASEGVQALPGVLARAGENLDGILAEIRANDLVARFSDAVDGAYEAAEDVSEALVDAPALVAEIEGLAGDLRALPIEAAVTQATELLASIDAVVDQESVRELPGELREAVSDLRILAAELAEAEVAAALSAALTSASAAADAVSAASEGTPELIAELRGFAANLRALPLAAAVESLTAVADGAGAVVNDPATQALPTALSEATAGLAALVADLQAAGLVDRLGDTLDAAADAATQIADATQGAPELIENLRATSETVRDLPLDAVAARLADVLASADGILSTQAARDLPEALNASLAELRAILADLNEGGAAENANAALVAGREAAEAASDAAANLPATLEAARRAADQVAAATDQLPATLNSARIAADGIAQASADLPALLGRLSATLRTAEGTLGTYADGGQSNRELVQALRDIQSAADAFEKLARTIERNPSAILTGR